MLSIRIRGSWGIPTTNTLKLCEPPSNDIITVGGVNVLYTEAFGRTWAVVTTSDEDLRRLCDMDARAAYAEVELASDVREVRCWGVRGVVHLAHMARAIGLLMGNPPNFGDFKCSAVTVTVRGSLPLLEGCLAVQRWRAVFGDNPRIEEWANRLEATRIFDNGLDYGFMLVWLNEIAPRMGACLLALLNHHGLK
jgi:hypothetical protein